MIGRGFLGDRILHEGAFRHALGGQHGRTAAAPFAGHRRSGAEHHRDDPLDAGVAYRVLKTGQMPAGDMAGLVREHADKLVRRLRAHDQAGIDEFVLPAGDKGIDLLVLDEIDVQRVRIEPRRLPDRGHHRPNVGLDFGIADEALGGGGLAIDDTRCQNDCCKSVNSSGHKRFFQKPISVAIRPSSLAGAAARANHPPTSLKE